MVCDERCYELPLEIWEKVLEYLVGDGYSLVSSSRVCFRWNQLARRVCQKFCTRYISKRLLAELVELNSSRSTGEIWIEVYRSYHETFLSSAPEEAVVLRSFDSSLSVNAADQYIFISNYEKDQNVSKIYGICSKDLSLDFSRCAFESVLNNAGNLWENSIDGKICKTCVLELSSPVLLIITTTSTMATVLPKELANFDDSRVINICPKIKCHPKTSAEGSKFLTEDSTNGDYLLLYDSFLDSLAPEELTVQLMYRFKTESPTYNWILSRNLIRTMETSGHIRAYIICYQSGNEIISKRKEGNHLEKSKSSSFVSSVSLCAESHLKKDLRYPNPTLFTKDFVFSSTIVSRDLLGYWHMDRDRDYWMIGEMTGLQCDERSTIEANVDPSPMPLHNVSIAQEVNQSVSALWYDRGILFCGTKEGHILGYKLQKEINGSSDFESLTTAPWIYITGVSNHPICKMGSLFTPLGLILGIGDESGRSYVVYLALEKK